MRLIKLELHGYRRFAQRAMLNLDGKVIALVGPNEAGKSSILGALQKLPTRTRFQRTGSQAELTRGATIPENQTVLKATYLLDDSNIDTLSQFPGTELARWYSVEYKASGEISTDIRPCPKRDLTKRQDTVRSIDAAWSSITTLGLDLSAPQTESLTSLMGEFASTADTLDKETLTRIAKLAGEMQEFFELREAMSESERPEIHAMLNRVNEQIEYENTNLANGPAEALFHEIPGFLLFSDTARHLQSEYDLNAISKRPPQALSNLAQVAQLDLYALRKAVSENEFGDVEVIVQHANNKLEKVLHKHWSQSGVTVRLSIDGTVLRIFVGTLETRYASFEERSEGLRQYVTLLAFVLAEGRDSSSILLIDEAETHLHYDAQADLMQMLTQQDVTSQVILTTHSMGCLPEDLGAGIRLVSPVGDYESTITNWFWENNTPGYSPLLFGMGATTLAFIPIRFAVMTEGASDFILLPAIFREAIAREYLGFQIAPGISVSDVEALSIIERESPRTVYLLDADEAGKKLRSKLRDAGIEDDRMFLLPDPDNLGLVVEDFVDVEVYVNAVNAELYRSHGSGHEVSVSDFTESNRPVTLDAWCRARGVKAPNKRSVAYRILEQKTEVPLINTTRRESLQQLFEDIQNRLTKTR